MRPSFYTTWTPSRHAATPYSITQGRPSIGPKHAGRPSITLFHASAAAIPSRQPISAGILPAPMPSWAHCFGGRPGDAHHGDLATDDGAAAVYTEANKAFGGIDILINNAGAYEARPWIC